MPSRPLPTPPPPHLHHHYSRYLLVAAFASCTLIIISFILAFLYFYFSLRRRRSPTLPFDFASSPALRRFSHRDLRSATAVFDPSRLLGRGASASVFRGLLPDGKSVAVKSISASPISDHEFKNELAVLSSLRPSPFVVSLLGYCNGRDQRLLVYEHMANGSLQEALFSSSSSCRPELGWDRRFQIILDVARGLEFLHLECDPPVVHGDIKPSNVLLGSDFRAKIADFGLARLKMNEAELSQDLGFLPSQELCSPAMHMDLDFDFEFSRGIRAASCNKNEFEGRIRSNPIASIEKGKEMAAVAPSDDEGGCFSKELNDGDWWWKQEGSAELNSRDYVREWIGTGSDWETDERKSDLDEAQVGKSSVNDNGGDVKDKPRRKQADSCGKEWWKEEYFAEMSKKSKCNKGISWFRKGALKNNVDREMNAIDASFRKGGWKMKMKRKRSRSVGSEMFSGDLFSRELSSTATSVRGTICYVAPEHGGCGRFVEKADIYSFGVLVLVIVSGRRPLHVLSSPMRLERANLVSWCRQLASSGNVLDLVDERLRDCFDKEQANVCINLALSCLQKLPELRPDSGDIVKMLNGEMELPVVRYEFSPSPNSRRMSKARRKGSHDPE